MQTLIALIGLLHLRSARPRAERKAEADLRIAYAGGTRGESLRPLADALLDAIPDDDEDRDAIAAALDTLVGTRSVGRPRKATSPRTRQLCKVGDLELAAVDADAGDHGRPDHVMALVHAPRLYVAVDSDDDAPEVVGLADTPEGAREQAAARRCADPVVVELRARGLDQDLDRARNEAEHARRVMLEGEWRL